MIYIHLVCWYFTVLYGVLFVHCVSLFADSRMPRGARPDHAI
jgi:hypothetical protein